MDNLFFKVDAAMGMLVDSGISEIDSVAILVSLKNTKHCIEQSDAYYFDRGKLDKIIREKKK